MHIYCMCHESLTKYINEVDSDVRPLLTSSFTDNPGAPGAQWVKRWPTDLANRVRSSLAVKSSQP